MHRLRRRDGLGVRRRPRRAARVGLVRRRGDADAALAPGLSYSASTLMSSPHPPAPPAPRRRHRAPRAAAVVRAGARRGARALGDPPRVVHARPQRRPRRAARRRPSALGQRARTPPPPPRGRAEAARPEEGAAAAAAAAAAAGAGRDRGCVCTWARLRRCRRSSSLRPQPPRRSRPPPASSGRPSP